ncbi:MAG: LysR family transcriptional regulator [Solirubrobacteraceae bacterium]
MLDVRRLRVLREFAARGTIAATADALGYTPPAVSQQLAALEREAGVDLLERNGRTRRLTPAGEELVVRTESVLRELEAAEAALERTVTTVAGVLRAAAFPSAHRALLPPAVVRLAREHPELEVHTRELEPEDSIPALKVGELDLVLAQEYPFAPLTADPALERTHLREDPIRLAVPAGHALAAAPHVDLAEHAAVPWVAGRQGSFCHAVVLHVCRAAGVEPRITHFTNDFTTAYVLVAAGVGFALVPELAGPPPPGVALVETAQPVPSRRIFAAVRAGSGARPAVAACLRALSDR